MHLFFFFSSASRSRETPRQCHRARSLLHYACYADDDAAVEQLLWDRAAREAQLRCALAQAAPQLNVFRGTTPLLAAMAFASWNVVPRVLTSPGSAVQYCYSFEC